MKTVAASAAWLLSGTVVLALVTLPVSVQAQTLAGLVIVAAMMLMKQLRLRGAWRLVALSLGTALVLRYVYWRTTSTLPPVTQPVDFTLGLLLYLAEMYSVSMLALSIFVVATPLPPRAARTELSADPPRVDVFIPTYNEGAALLKNTLAAAQAMDYPRDRFTVWLLDDGGTEEKRRSERILEASAAERRHEELKRICQEFGANYLPRERNEAAKAGNLNNGLALSTGELVAVFDADHAPARDFLKETVPGFEEEPRLFLVQTPHFFLNPDPLERNLETFERMPSENEMFYGVIQRGLDKWNASFFCGSAAVLRREALEEVGGFKGVSITEDCETAVALHARGWKSIYVDKPLIAGLQPATFASFIGQRSRWAQGMMQILLMSSPVWKRGLSLPQRLCYMSSTLFWLFPIPRTIFFAVPLAYLFFDRQIFTASGGEFLAYTLSYMIANLMIQNYLYGTFRWPWISELYEFVQSVYLLPAVISVLVRPRGPKFKVTPKDESVSRSRLSELSWPFFAIFGVLLLGVVATVWKLNAEPFKADITLVVGAWNAFNLLMAGCALGVIAEKGQRRAPTRRVQVGRRCEVGLGGRWYPGTIDDVSVGGTRVQVYSPDPVEVAEGSAADLVFKPQSDWLKGALPVAVRHVAPGEGGTLTLRCRFTPTETVHHRLVADLLFANSAQWTEFQRRRRRNSPGLIRGSAWFLATALYQTGRGFGYALRLLRAGAAEAAAGTSRKGAS